MTLPKRLETTKTDSVFWAIDVEQHLQRLQTPKQGLSDQEAQARLKRFGPIG